MSQAYIFLGTGYEEVEMLTVVDMLRRADISIDMVSITGAKEVLPGGIPGTPNLRNCEPLCRQLKLFADSGKWVAAVCAAPTILGDLEILQGKKATCYPSFSDKLTTGEYIKQPVVVDGHVITSRGMGTCIEFAGAIIEALKDKDTADAVKKAIIYNDTY
jgi:4-methyl-5(b-hydroxyethyl)-thiazole monophosphate biosynthesis